MTTVVGFKNGTHELWCFFLKENILFQLNFPGKKLNDGIQKNRNKTINRM